MKVKNFEYHLKDVKQLKIDIAFRLFFSVLFVAIFVWQFASMAILSGQKSLSTMHLIISVIVLFSTLLLFLATFAYALKDFRIISTIKSKGKCLMPISILFQSKKRGFLRLYYFLIQLLTFATTLLLVGCLTYSILQVAYLSSVSFYMPFLMMICISGYNSIYHIKDEIHTQETVLEQQPLY